MNFAPGSIFFGGATFFNPAAPTGAFNGTSMNGTLVQLGQAVGTVGNPAALIAVEEIPLATFGLLLSGMTAANPAITIKEAVTASRLNNPQILFTDSTGAECGRVVMGGSFGQYILIGQGCGALANAATPGNGIIALGDFAASQIVTGQTIIAIGSGALQGTGPLVQPNNIIAIGNDVLDRNGGTIADAQLVIGNNSLDGGAAPSLGARGLFIGHSISSGGGNSANIGADVLIIGHSVNPGAVSNIIAIGNLQNGTNKINLSNVIILGDDTKNTLLGFPVNVPWTDNGSRLQVNGNISASGGVRANIRTTAVLAETFGAADYTILADATAGAFNCNIDPTTKTGRFGNLKKIDATANTVTLTALSGNIFGLGAPAPTFVLNTQGQNISFQSDGTNIYIL